MKRTLIERSSARSPVVPWGRKASLFGTLLVAIVAHGQYASAQRSTEGFSLDRFAPSEPGSRTFVSDSLDIFGAFRPAGKLTLDYAYRPRVIRYEATDDSLRVVEHRLNVHLATSVVLFDRLRASVHLPITVVQTGEGGTLGGYSFLGGDRPALGDPSAGGDLRLFGKEASPLRLAVGSKVYIPLGSKDRYTSDGTVRVLGRVMAAGNAGRFSYAGSAGFMFRGVDSTDPGVPEGSELLLSAAGHYELLSGKLSVGPEVWLATPVSAPFSSTKTPTEVLAGAHYQLTKELRLNLGVGVGVLPKVGAPAFRSLFSLEWAPENRKPPPDRDGDGILDAADACPDIPGTPSENAKKNGCPPPQDFDDDGILDADDACPDKAGPPHADKRRHGCPPPPDSDKDGVPDSEDACPNKAGIPSPDPKKNGCPPPPPDRDKDGIPDESDACPDTSGIASADPRFHGCTEDIDGDGIVNTQDACPTQPGKPDPDAKKNGCPKAFVSGGQIRILDQVRFRTGNAEIEAGRSTQDVLEAVLKILSDHPEIKKLRIEGHTDNVGRPQDNRTLSSLRAFAVSNWLIRRGVDKSRLVYIGHGQDKPIASNDTDAGRMQNRRVEFHIEQGAPK